MQRDDLGKLVLRVAVGGLMLFHGIAKLRHWSDTVGFLEHSLDDRGLPSFIAYGVFLGEVLAPLLIVLGLFTRPAAIVLVINMVATIWLPARGGVFQLNRGGGWTIELEVLFLLGAVALVFLGAGRFSVRGGKPAVD